MDERTKAKPKGHVHVNIRWLDGREEDHYVPNAVLDTGRNAMASSLANDIGDAFNFYVARMLFGDGGTIGGDPQVVDAGRTGLFGATRVTKAVVAQVNPQNTNQAIFTSVMTYQEGNGYAFNEMALQLNNGSFFSMATFPDLTKTEQMQITFNWFLTFV